MKKSLVFCLCLVLILSLSFVSAGFFDDIWNKIIGNAVASTICTSDSDCGVNEYCDGASAGTCSGGICTGRYVNSCTYSGSSGSCSDWEINGCGGCEDGAPFGCSTEIECFESYGGECPPCQGDDYECSGTPDCSECDDLGPDTQPPQHCNPIFSTCAIGWSQVTCEWHGYFDNPDLGCVYTSASGDCFDNSDCDIGTCEDVTLGTCEPLIQVSLCEECSKDSDCLSGNCAVDSEQSKSFCVSSQSSCALAWFENSNCEVKNGETACVRDTHKAKCNNGAWTNYVSCSSTEICEEGICINKTSNCVDSDGGLNYYVKGTSTGTNGVHTDWCGNGGINEYICQTDGSVEQIIDECPNGCEEGACIKLCDYNVEDLESNLDIRKILRNVISARCDLDFTFELLNEIPEGYSKLSDRRVVAILNITPSNSTEAILNFTIYEEELNTTIDELNIHVWENEWVELESEVEVLDSENKIYNSYVLAPHFSLFLITEPDLCGNDVFDSDYEECDGTDNCTSECICEEGFVRDENGFCLQGIEGEECSEEGDEDCVGYILYKCEDDLEWEKKGIVLDKCGVECSPIGDNSCEGEYPIKCGSDYSWKIQKKVSGLCDYEIISSSGSLISTFQNKDSNKDEKKEKLFEGQQFVIFLIVLISLVILFIVYILFNIYKKRKRESSNKSPDRSIPPEHRPGPKRHPGRPLEHNKPVGRPPLKKYPIRRYPQRRRF